MNVRRFSWLTVLALLLALAGCAGGLNLGKTEAAPTAPVYADGMGQSIAAPMMAKPMSPAEARGRDEPMRELDFKAKSAEPPAPPSGATSPTTPAQVIAPLLIYTATLDMAVFETKQAIDNVEGYAREIGGYLVSRDDGAIVVRVPAAKYGAALDKIAAMGELLHRQESVEDVTDQFYDLEAHLKNARALRDQLQELLKQAKDVKDALAVEQELGRVTGDIEALEGKLKRLSELIHFSTITVRFSGKSSHVEPKVRLPFKWLDQLGLPHLRSL